MVLTSAASDYGRKVEFAKGKVLVFPDCELVFLGTRKVNSPVFKPGYTYYDFHAIARVETKAVCWSSGTGDIGPAFFRIGGKAFLLELNASEVFKGYLKDNELVLWRDKINRGK